MCVWFFRISIFFIFHLESNRSIKELINWNLLKLRTNVFVMILSKIPIHRRKASFRYENWVSGIKNLVKNWFIYDLQLISNLSRNLYLQLILHAFHLVGEKLRSVVEFSTQWILYLLFLWYQWFEFVLALNFQKAVTCWIWRKLYSGTR